MNDWCFSCSFFLGKFLNLKKTRLQGILFLERFYQNGKHFFHSMLSWVNESTWPSAFRFSRSSPLGRSVASQAHGHVRLITRFCGRLPRCLAEGNAVPKTGKTQRHTTASVPPRPFPATATTDSTTTLCSSRTTSADL